MSFNARAAIKAFTKGGIKPALHVPERTPEGLVGLGAAKALRKSFISDDLPPVQKWKPPPSPSEPEPSKSVPAGDTGDSEEELRKKRRRRRDAKQTSPYLLSAD